MTAGELLRSLATEGVHVRVIGDGELRVRARRGVVTEARRELLREHKRELVELLTTHPCTNCGRFAFPVPTRCYWCRHPVEAST